MPRRSSLAVQRCRQVANQASGQVVLELKTAWREGTTHLVMSPLVFLQRLAALVPRPRLLARVFDIDVRHCPICGSGRFKILAAILDRAVIEKILRHLGLDPQPAPRPPVRPVRPHAG